jgi:hypothetical protein
MEALATTLTELGAAAFRWSAIAFLVLNGAAGTVVWLTRDRRLVNRFTAPLLAANLFLLGTGVGIPALTYSMRLVVNAVSASSQPEVTIDHGQE